MTAHTARRHRLTRARPPRSASAHDAQDATGQLEAALARDDATDLASAVLVAAALQGTEPNDRTGEAAGKIFSTVMDPAQPHASTLYRSSQSTALYLIALQRYRIRTGDVSGPPAPRVPWNASIVAAAAWLEQQLDPSDRFLVSLDDLSPMSAVAQVRVGGHRPRRARVAASAHRPLPCTEYAPVSLFGSDHRGSSPWRRRRVRMRRVC